MALITKAAKSFWTSWDCASGRSSDIPDTLFAEESLSVISPRHCFRFSLPNFSTNDILSGSRLSLF